jgi:hypothetical protein
MICPVGLCDTLVGDTFMLRDTGHLSIEASRYLGTKFDLVGQVVATEHAAD